MASITTDLTSDKRVSFFDKELVLLFLVSKILVVLSLVGFYYYLDEFHGLNLWNRRYTGAESPDFFFMPFSNWDGQNYLLLADWGYNVWQPGNAFFPLFPLLIRFVKFLLQDFYLSAFILNLILSYAFFFTFYQYGTHHLNKNKTTKALILFLCYPTAFYLTVFYSETLFLFLLFGFLYFYEVRKSNLSLLFAVLLPLTRAQAVFIPVALVILVIIKLLDKNDLNIKYEVINLLAFLLGGLFYLLFFYLKTGSPTSGIEAQSQYLFNNAFINIFKPWLFVRHLFTPSGEWFTYNNALIDKIFIVIILLSTVVVYKSKKPLWLVFYILLIYPPASMGQGGAFTRFSLIAIPFLALAIWKTYPTRQKLILTLSLFFLIIQLVFILRFSLNNWVG